MNHEFGSWQTFLDKCLKSKQAVCILASYLEDASFKEELTTVLDERLVLKEKWIVEYLKTKTRPEDRKCNKTSNSLRQAGNNLFKHKKNIDAFKKYSEAILHAQHGTAGEDSELSLGFANRSAVLFHQKKYRCCIQDIDNAILCNYPMHLAYKLHLRKGQCYYHIHEYDESLKVFLEARQSIKVAGLTDEKSDVLNHEVDDWIKKVASSLGYSKSENGVKSKIVSHGKSPLLINASSALVMQYSEDKGRHILASKEIKIGDTLIIEKPYAAVLLPDHYETHCHHCFVTIHNFVPCCKCNEAKYCSFECSRSSWEKYHRWECGLLTLLHAIGIAHLSLRIILVSGLEYLTCFRKKHIDKHAQEKLNKIAGTNNEGVYQCDYLAVYELLPHIDRMEPSDLLQYAVTAELLLRCLQCRGYFETDVIDNIEKLSLNVEKRTTDVFTIEDVRRGSAEAFIGNLLLRHMCQLVCNAHAITAVQVSDSIDCTSALLTQEQVRIATAIYPTTSLLNHSCDPTIINSFDKDTLVVRAVKNVPVGGEVFNCYGPHYKRMPRFKRQDILREQYFFTCHCQNCEDGQLTELKYQALKCPECEGPLILKPPCSDFVCVECGHKTQALAEMKQVLNAGKLFNQGCTLMQAGEIRGAINFLEKCRKVRSELVYKYHRDLAEVNDSLARCYCAIGNYEEGVKYLAESTKANKIIYGEESIEYGHELQKYSEVLVNARKVTEAFQTATTAERIFVSHYGETHHLVVEMRDYLRKLQMLNTF